MSMSSTVIPCARASAMMRSMSAGHRYAGSAGSFGSAGRVGAVADHLSTFWYSVTPSCW
jgi:hypothetical protein